MLAITLYNFFAQAYGSGAYNTALYSGDGTNGGSSLSNTGIAIVSIITIATTIMLIAIVVRIWRRPNKQAAEVVDGNSANK